MKLIKYRKSAMRWFILRRPDPKVIRKKNKVLFAPKIFPLCKEVPLSKSGLNSCNNKDWEEIVLINLKQKFGIKNKALKKTGYCCSKCNINLLDNSTATHFHHILPVRYGGKTILNNLIPLCSNCHGLITKAQASRFFRPRRGVCHRQKEGRNLGKRQASLPRIYTRRTTKIA